MANSFNFDELDSLRTQAPSLFAIPGILLALCTLALLQVFRAFIPATDTVYHISHGASKHAELFDLEAIADTTPKIVSLIADLAELGLTYSQGSVISAPTQDNPPTQEE